MKFKFKNKDSKTGFTLIEMIISVAVFTVVMVIAMMSFLNINDVQRRVSSMRAVNGNLGFALELMLREIRAGTSYCSGACTSSSFNFISAQGDPVIYRWYNNSIERSSDGGLGFLRLTSDEINIENLEFLVDGESVGDNIQPLVTIILSGWMGEKERIRSSLNIQTTISQRRLDS